jgi:hypothetical protein
MTLHAATELHELISSGAGSEITTSGRFEGSYALWLERDRADYAFYLGAGALALVAVVLTGFAGLLVKRTMRVTLPGGAGGEISDQGGEG